MKKSNNTALDIIKKFGTILKEEELQKIINLKEELNDTFLYSQVFRTRTEMEMSVLNDIIYPTPDSKYWQSVREQNLMFTQLVYLSFDYKKTLIELKKLEYKLDKIKNDLDRELVQVEIERKKFNLKQAEREAKDRIREIVAWHEIKDNLLPATKFSLTDVDEHQLLSYTKRFIHQYFVNKNTMQYKDVGETVNLIGQLKSSLRLCKEKNILDKALENIPQIEIEAIKIFI